LKYTPSAVDLILEGMVHHLPLIESLKSIIERSYGMSVVIEDIAPFIVGDAGYRALYGGTTEPVSWEGRGARILVREAGPMLRVALYYPDGLVRHLERFNPLQGIGDVNITAFAVLVEELDHLLTLAHRAAERRPVSLLELEHHANVTKYLVVVHFLGRQADRRRLPEPLKIWARHHLFERFSREEGEREARYRDAARLATKYVSYLESLPIERRRAELRAFHRRPFADTLMLLEQRN
jgi:hypothetical protein